MSGGTKDFGSRMTAENTTASVRGSKRKQVKEVVSGEVCVECGGKHGGECPHHKRALSVFPGGDPEVLKALASCYRMLHDAAEANAREEARRVADQERRRPVKLGDLVCSNCGRRMSLEIGLR